MEKEIQFSCEEVFNKLNRRQSLFNDEKYLDVNYISDILHRQEELSQLITIYSSLITNPGAYSVNQFVYGKAGVGKTSTIKYFATELVKIAKKRKITIHYIHINCKKERTSYKILISVLRSFNKKFPTRGYSPQDLIDVLKEYLNQLNTHLLLVLDDLDYVLEKDSDILYYLTRLNEESIKPEQKQRLSIIGILKDLTSIQAIYGNIRDFFQKNIIKFKSYNENQLFDILKNKTKKCFRSSVIDDDLIIYIVSIVKERGDLRCAMNLLWKAGKVAESENLPMVTKECVDIANQEYYPINSFEYLKYKPKEKLIFLLGVIKVVINSRKRQITIKEIQDEYLKLCKELNVDPKSYTQIWNYIQEYKREEILKVSLGNKNSRGRGRKSYVEIFDAPLPQLESEIITLLNLEGIVFDSKS